jgi:IS1 family transposase
MLAFTRALMYTIHVANRLDDAKRAKIIQTICEGNSLRSTARLNDCALNTVIKLLVEVGTACESFHNEHVTGLDTTTRVECDEIWQFVGAKEKNVPETHRGEFGWGDVWTWTCIDADHKLMVAWYVGMRTPEDGQAFMYDLASRLTDRVQLTSDGLAIYKKIVLNAFGMDVDFAQLIKEYGNDPSWEKRYSPATCTGIQKKAIIGDPDEKLVSTSYVERQNLNIRMGCRRFTRLTNAFSKKVENHAAAVALYVMFFNFCRPHQTLTKDSGPANNRTKTTPAMAVGLTDKVWTVEEMLRTVVG